jgi:hypothetical protein
MILQDVYNTQSNVQDTFYRSIGNQLSSCIIPPVTIKFSSATSETGLPPRRSFPTETQT